MVVDRNREVLPNALHLWAVLDEDAIDVEGTRVWTGLLSEACNRAELSKGQYDKVLRFLKATDCIVVLLQGNRYNPTLVQLAHPPDEEIFSDYLLTDHAPSGKLEQKVNDLVRLIGGLNLIERLDRIEARITKLEQHTNTKGEKT